MQVNDSFVKFKVDTGAAVTALPASLMEKIGLEVRPSQKMLRGAGNQNLVTKGEATVELRVKGKRVYETVYLVENLVTPLLGKPAIAKLKLIEFTDAISVDSWKSRFPELFTGLGTMKSAVKIKLKADHVPFAQAVPRRVAAARREPLRKELKRMEAMGVIEKIETPTEWCSPCIVVPKKNDSIRVCIDFTKLNKAITREYHPLPTTEETLSQLGAASHFTKLDANSGYWQLRLDESAYHLTTFITPFGRYFCKRLPFGICSAPEIYQREMQKALVGLEGVTCQMDDILIYGCSQEEHDIRVEMVLKKLSEAGITLNPDKCEFDQNEVKFLGHVINKDGIHADPEKTKAIRDFGIPKDRKGLRRFFGMVNYLGKFTATLAQDSSSLRLLLHQDSDWIWSTQQNNEFEYLKDKLSHAPTLIPYQLDKEVLLSTDASSYGLGAVILQQVDGDWRPVAFASRALTSAESRYAQIEKEALAICWACDKFHYYLAGRKFRVETDHKPLISVLGDKELAKLPIRVQRFRLKMMAYDYDIQYTPGEKLVLADTLSRAPVESEEDNDRSGTLFIQEIVESLPIAKNRLAQLQTANLVDEEASLIMSYVMNGWPSYHKVHCAVQKFYTFKDHITVIDGVIYYWDQLFIPQSERERVMKDIHRGHQGENKCLRRAKSLVWWPGMTVDIRKMVQQCDVCQEFRHVPREPLQITSLPHRPWWTLATDVCEFESRQYLVLVDYYSRYIVARKLDNCEMSTIVKELEEVFCMLGIPHSIVSDNASYYKGEMFQKFLSRWDISHVTSAPLKSQSNGEAERAVQTVKRLMEKNMNLQAALCCYRDTPLESGYSPAQLLFGRSLNSMGIGNWRSVDEKRFKDRDEQMKIRQKRNYDQRYSVRARSPLRLLQPVKIVDGAKRKTQMAVVVGTNGREVLLEKDGKILRRNRAHVRKVPESRMNTENQTIIQPDEPLLSVPQLPPKVMTPSADSSDPSQSVVAVATKSHGAIAPHQSQGVVAPNLSQGAIAPTQSRGVVAPDQSQSAIAPTQSRGVVAPKQSQSAVALNQSRGVVAPNQSQSAVALNQSQGVVAPNQSSSAVALSQPSQRSLQNQTNQSTVAVATKQSRGAVALSQSNSESTGTNVPYKSRFGRQIREPRKLDL